MTIYELIARVNAVILNPTILLLFSIAFVVFVAGLVQFLAHTETDDGRAKGKRKIVWGLVGMFIMFSVFGILRFVLMTFGIPTSGVFLL